MITARKQEFLLKENIKKLFWDYCENTTIHGFKYIGEKHRPNIERIWWLIVLGLGMTGSAYLIDKVWHKWHDSPVIMSFSEASTPVWQIPFPTVTICSETKSRQRAYNFSNAMFNTNLTKDEAKMRDDISLICDRYISTNGPKFTDESTINVIRMVAPQYDEMMWQCKWQADVIHCSELFTSMMTEEGICFSFNILNTKKMYRDVVVQSRYEDNLKVNSEWSLEKGYDESAPLETEPRRALGAGVQAGVIIVLRAYEDDLDYLCRGPVQGFKILLHNPAEIPSLSERYFRVPHDQELVLSVKPNLVTTSEDLRSYQPSTRQCYFPSERQLAYFKTYTQRNCELECLTNYTRKRCQCVALHMPRLESTQLCGAGSKECVYKAKDELNMEIIMLSIQKTQTSENTCDCLPACTTLQYDAETSQAPLDWIKAYDAYRQNMTKSDGVLYVSKVSIFFKDVQFITSGRSELYGIADFLATCGGLLGLFSGVSVLSLIEIIYYITLRFFTIIRSQTENKEVVGADHQCHCGVLKTDLNRNKNLHQITVIPYKLPTLTSCNFD